MAKDGDKKPAKFNLEEYVMVKDRVDEFYQKYPTGRIITTIIEHDKEMGFVMIRAEIFRFFDEATPASTGHAYELKSEGFVNKTSYVENCETSAVGRALGLSNFKITGSIASREEMEKVERMSVEPSEEIAGKIKTIWLEGGGTEEKLDSWVKNNNGGLGLMEISAHRQQAMLTRLEAKKAQAEKTQPVQPPAQAAPKTETQAA
jgi:hypothetical protein